MPSRNLPSSLVFLAGTALVVAVLHWARPILLPLAIAVLLSVVLMPLVRRVERLHIGRIPAVIIVVLTVAGLLGGTGWVVRIQLGELTTQLPAYRENVEEKLRSLRASVGLFERSAEQIQELQRELAAGGTGKAEPTKVEVVGEEPGALDLLQRYAGSVVAPFATAGLVVVMLLFILVQRDDLRDRLIRILGQRDLHLTTQAMQDAGARVTRYLRALSLLNAGHGLVIGVGLWLFGLPAALLFGLLSALLRFVPYVGPWVAATLPVALSVAVFDGWTTTLGILGFLAAVELLSNNVAEPWLYGSSVGLHPFAVILSAIFWTWVWGGAGLLLATPLTVALVVMGRHLPQLEFFSILLGDEPALHPAMRLYQRLLARDLHEATDLIEEHLETQGVEASWEGLFLPAVALLERGRRQDRVGAAQLAFAQETLDLAAGEIVAAEQASAGREEDEPSAVLALAPIDCLPAREYGDEILCRALCRSLEAAGFRARAARRVLTAELVERVAAEAADVVCISALPPGGAPLAHYLGRRLLERRSDLALVVGLWGAPDEVAGVRERLLRAARNGARVRVVHTLSAALDALASFGRAAAERRRAQEEAPGAAGAAGKEPGLQPAPAES